MREQGYTLRLEGIDCPSCAERIESALKHAPHIRDVNLDFSTNTLRLCGGDLASVERIITKLEPHARIIEAFDLSGARIEWEQSPQHTRFLSQWSVVWILIALFALAQALLHLPLFESPLRIPLASALLLALYAVAGLPIFRATMRNVKNKIFFDENSLMLLATLAALCLGDVSEAVAVMLFFRVGELLESRAVQKSKDSISALLAIMPDVAHKKQGERVLDVKPSELCVGDEIIVRLGEKLPTDALVLAGRSYLDMRSINGESVPVGIKEGESALAGAINTGAPLTMRVLKAFEDSHIAKIARLLQEASSNKARTDRLITRFARIYTPIVFVLALCVALIPPLLGGVWSEWVYRALVVMMISCPCALVIAVPLGYFAAIGRASALGVLFKGSIHLENLAQVRHIAFDKTGTLTQGSFEILEIKSRGIERKELLLLASALEAHSSHPIARAICASAVGKGELCDEVEEIGGRGMRGRLAQDGREILIGNAALLREGGIALPESKQERGIKVYVALGGECVGVIHIGDRLKSEACEVMRELRALGIAECAVISGDTQENVTPCARELGIEHAYGGLLPEGKARTLEKLKSRWKGKVAFVGDGINDALVLKSSDVGVSINAGENDISKESADIILTSPNLSSLARAVALARHTRTITWQNISFALGSKLVLIVLGILGLANMWLAVFGDVGVALLALLNAMRVGRGVKG